MCFSLPLMSKNLSWPCAYQENMIQSVSLIFQLATAHLCVWSCFSSVSLTSTVNAFFYRNLLFIWSSKPTKVDQKDMLTSFSGFGGPGKNPHYHTADGISSDTDHMVSTGHISNSKSVGHVARTKTASCANLMEPFLCCCLPAVPSSCRF